MKKAIFFPISCSNIKLNEFEACRSEGRHVINIAFGFSLLGYECHIINNWNLKEPIKIWDNVYIENRPNPNEIYDIAFTYDNVHIVNSKNYRHKIVMTYESSNINKALEYIRKNGVEKIILACSHRSVKDNSTNVYNLKYFPALFPISSINIGFVPYKYKPQNNELKIYVYHSSWPGTANGASWRYITKQNLIFKFLRSKNVNLKLFVHVENENISPFGSPTNGIEINYIHNASMFYKDMIELIQKVDLCISTGGLDRPGSSTMDIISLGKPLICVNDGVSNKSPWNILYDCSEYIISIQESDMISLEKLDKIFSNLEMSYNCYKNTVKEYDFSNWKHIVEKLLGEL